MGTVPLEQRERNVLSLGAEEELPTWQEESAHKQVTVSVWLQRLYNKVLYFPNQAHVAGTTQSLSEKPFDLVFLLSRSSGSHALMPVTLTNELVYLKSTFFKSFHEHKTANYADFRYLMRNISCYLFYEEKPPIALKPEVRPANSSTRAMPKSCSRESGCRESSAKHKGHRTKAVKTI